MWFQGEVMECLLISPRFQHGAFISFFLALINEDLPFPSFPSWEWVGVTIATRNSAPFCRPSEDIKCIQINWRTKPENKETLLSVELIFYLLSFFFFLSEWLFWHLTCSVDAVWPTQPVRGASPVLVTEMYSNLRKSPHTGSFDCASAG